MSKLISIRNNILNSINKRILGKRIQFMHWIRFISHTRSGIKSKLTSAFSTFRINSKMDCGPYPVPGVVSHVVGKNIDLYAFRTPNENTVKIDISNIQDEQKPLTNLSITGNCGNETFDKIFSNYNNVENIFLDPEFITIKFNEVWSNKIENLMKIIIDDLVKGKKLSIQDYAIHENSMIELQNIIDNYVQSFVKSHGGYIQLVDFKKGIVYVKLAGSCDGCSYSEETLLNGVLRILQYKIGNEIEDIQSIQTKEDQVGIDMLKRLEENLEN